MTAGAGPDLERQALAALRKMRERLDAIEAARSEPLAIVGMACRLPGAPDLASFWDLLCRGGNAIREYPGERWDAAALAPEGDALVVPQRAGLLDSVDGFDAEFFGITGREAQLMDPQQRLFLEVVWEALESAGIPPLGLKGTRTGVFVGTTTTDYLHLLYQRLAGAELDAYLVSGNTLNATAGRISYTLGLQGPAMAIDTACSSSLVAIDRACRSVRDGESRLAIAGGVNLILAPELVLSLARWGMLSPDGHCKTFDAAADGFVRAEGCGVILIKRLSDALADGDRIWALLRGWAVNQGGPSSGFAVPNGLAQASVLSDALAGARVAPGSVGYVEAHGTGTPLGDPIEMEAIASVYGADRIAGQPLWVGAVKSNVGHLEAAAGVTGLIKTVLALQHRQIPPNVHFHQPTPHIPWDRIPVRVPTSVEAWPPIAGRRLAGVSAFGFSGTNAHIVLEEAPASVAVAAHPAPPAWLLTLSARSPVALNELAARHAERLARPDVSDALVAAMCLAASAGRSHLPHRLAVSAGDTQELGARLRAAAGGAPASAGLARGRAGGHAGCDRPGVAFLFTGQGAQYLGMGRRLAQASPVFEAALQRCAAIIDPLIERSLLDLMFDPASDAAVLDQTGFTQPALFAIGFALTEVWRSLGVTPALVLGHSVGEFAAACCAGVLSLEDAATLVTLRGRLMQALPAGGAMAAVFAPEGVVRERLAMAGGLVTMAGINGPDETVLSGDGAALRALMAAFGAAGVRCEPIAVSHAFHSPLMQPMLARFAEAAQRIVCSPPQVSVVSAMTGLRADAAWGTPAYWVQQLQAPVRFFDALRSVAACGVGVAVEIGPAPVLAGLGRRALADAPITWLASLRRGHDDATTLMGTLGELYVEGAVDDWSGPAGAAARAMVDLPAYPFQRSRHWVDAPAARASAPRAAWLHPLLGAPLPLATADVIFESAAGDARHAYVRDHRLHNQVIWPASACVEMLLAAAQQVAGSGDVELLDLELRAPLVLTGDASIALQTVLHPMAAGGWSAEICHAPPAPPGPRQPRQAGVRWPAFAAARLVPATAAADAPALDATVLRERCRESVDADVFYAALAAAGAPFGDAFRSVDSIFRAPGEAFARVSLAGSHDGHLIHPVLLDGCLQIVSVADAAPAHADGALWLPTHVARLVRHAVASQQVWCHAVLRPAGADARVCVADLAVWNDDGQALATLEGVRFERVRASDVGGVAGGLVATAGHQITWRPRSGAARATPAGTRWLLLAPPGAMGAALAEALRAGGDAVALQSADRLAAGPQAFGAALRECAAALGGPPRHIVHLVALALPAEPEAGASLPALQPALASALHLVQGCAEAAGDPPPQLCFVTRAAQAVRAGESAAPLAATLWGFGRVARAEHPALGCHLIDIDAACTAEQLAQALRSLDGSETQLALRGGEPWVARLAALRPARHFRLTAPRPGRIDDLALTPYVAAQPGPGEVRIEVQAAGLNFRDVLCALGMFPGRVDALGSECAGVITAIGAGVTGFGVGDAVFALAIGSLGTSVLVPAPFVAHRPAFLSAPQAAALPIACLTASLGLEDLAALQPGERVLIHAATGGVGMAALQLARLLGAEVFATAGSPTKRDHLRALGVAQVFDSRSLAFRDEILARTGGQGVHVVLNALAGDFIAASLSLLRPGGRFLEMGKRDIWSAGAVAQQHPGVHYLPFDLGDAALRDAGLAPRLFARLLARLAKRQLTPLPVAVFPLSEPHAAFETMVQARHMGKLVLCRDVATPAVPLPLRADASYLVSGGFGALGLAVAEALVAHGARHLVLIGRRAPSLQAGDAVARLLAQGVAVRRAAVDVADLAALTALLDEMARDMPPLRGVIHAAGVLDDGVLTQQDWARFKTVLGPKLQGGLNLAALTAQHELDFFVLFSAGAAWLGAPGQANYAAANAALDALAATLRASGRPATSIAWGRWAGAGMASGRGVGGAQRWAAMGVGEIAPARGIEAMFELIERSATSAAVLPMDWRVYLGQAHPHAMPGFFAEVAPQGGLAAGQRVAAEPGALAQWQALPAHQRREALQRWLEALLRKVIGLPVERAVDPRLPLRDLGMDSLMTVELRNAIGRAVDRTLSATLVFDYPTLDALTDHLLAILPGLQVEPVPVSAAAQRAGSAEVQAMSEAEAEAQLLRELSDETPR